MLGLKSVSNLSTVVGLAIHEDFRARAAGAVADAGAAVAAGVDSLIELLEAAAERATLATESLVNVISLSPNTAMGQVLVINGASKPSEEEEVGEVPLSVLLLPVLVLLLGELLHELDEVLGGDNFRASFVLFSCALSLSALAVGGVDAAVEPAVAATGTADAPAAAGSTIITLLMGIAVAVVDIAVTVPIPMLVLRLFASAS